MARTRNTTTGTVATTTPAKAPAKRAAKVAPATPVVGPYRLVQLHANSKLVATALALAASHPGNQGAAATAMAQHMPTGRCTPGQLAMLCYQGGQLYNGQPLPLARYGTTDAGAPTTPAQLALAIAGQAPGTPGGLSWGRLAARYGVTEATCRAAYAAATGRHHGTTGTGAWAWRNASA